MLGFHRQIAEAVDQFILQVDHFFNRFHVFDAFVHLDLLVAVANIAIRNISIFRQHDFHFRNHFFLHAGAALFNRLFKHLRIQIKADRIDKAVLLRTEQIARPANRQIAHGDFKARAKFGEFLDRHQAFFCDIGQHFIALIHEISICYAARASDAAAQLIELRQAHAVGIIDDQCIDVRYINAGFDDRRRH